MSRLDEIKSRLEKASQNLDYDVTDHIWEDVVYLLTRLAAAERVVVAAKLAEPYLYNTPYENAIPVQEALSDALAAYQDAA